MLLGKVTITHIEKINFNNVKLVNTINPHSYLITQSDKVFFEALNSSDVILPDGIGIVWARQLLYKINKIA